MELELLRLRFREAGVTGKLYLTGLRFPLKTLELPWKNNQRFISCIPQGVYKISRHEGQKIKLGWLLHNVSNRDGILIHPGNATTDTEGCILVGRYFKDEHLRLLESRSAFSELDNLLSSSNEQHTIRIRDIGE